MSEKNSSSGATPPPTKSNEPPPSDEAKKNAVEGAKDPAGTSPKHRAVGFDAVVKEERMKRALSFGPSAVRVAKPSNILIDIYGVICSWQFAATLKQYANAHLASHVKECWEERTMKLMMARMREQVIVDRYAGDQVPAIAPESAPLEEQKETAAVSVQWQVEHQHPTTKVKRRKLNLISFSLIRILLSAATNRPHGHRPVAQVLRERPPEDARLPGRAGSLSVLAL